MNLYRYIHLLPDNKTVTIDKEYKEPYVFSLTKPSDDYQIVSGNELRLYLVNKEAKNYDERKRQGLEYSNFMNARLVILRKNLPESLKDLVCGYIYEITNSTREQITEGLWFSAKREANEMQPDEILQGIVNEYSLPIYQEELIQEIKDRINLAIQELY